MLILYYNFIFDIMYSVAINHVNIHPLFNNLLLSTSGSSSDPSGSGGSGGSGSGPRWTQEQLSELQGNLLGVDRDQEDIRDRAHREEVAEDSGYELEPESDLDDGFANANANVNANANANANTNSSENESENDSENVSENNSGNNSSSNSESGSGSDSGSCSGSAGGSKGGPDPSSGLGKGSGPAAGPDLGRDGIDYDFGSFSYSDWISMPIVNDIFDVFVKFLSNIYNQPSILDLLVVFSG